ncbi:hypothetical protein B4096_0739 [Heyndrickxia coagulans]|nr:hypothetical protein B4096_0739 [Heyndrickxia coagulans]
MITLSYPLFPFVKQKLAHLLSFGKCRAFPSFFGHVSEFPPCTPRSFPRRKKEAKNVSVYIAKSGIKR